MKGKVIVAGGGAAGILAAWRAASLGASATLLEKNDRIGIKILISGGGKCNITHSGTVESLLAAFRPTEARFLRPACYRFTNRQIVDMLIARGLSVYTRPDGRIFPSDGTAKDVVAILASYLEEIGVAVRLQSAVTGIVAVNGAVTGVKMGDSVVECRQVVLCTGGCSYPATGTTGDGWKMARELGHSISMPMPALAPIITQPGPAPDWAGVALRDCLLRARQNGKEVARWRGDLLFTHRGVSGPSVLGISRQVAERLESGEVILEVDVAPNRSFEDVTHGIQSFTAKYPRKSVGAAIEELIPNRLVDQVMRDAGIERPNMIGAYLSAKARSRLVSTLKAWQIGAAASVPIEKGEVTAGGIALDEVDPHTMRSRRVRGLYLCGEILDIAGPVGGYNLQAAFATGYVAGETAARDAML